VHSVAARSLSFREKRQFSGLIKRPRKKEKRSEREREREREREKENREAEEEEETRQLFAAEPQNAKVISQLRPSIFPPLYPPVPHPAARVIALASRGRSFNRGGKPSPAPVRRESRPLVRNQLK